MKNLSVLGGDLPSIIVKFYCGMRLTLSPIMKSNFRI
jgi:hypothetical protein